MTTRNAFIILMLAMLTACGAAGPSQVTPGGVGVDALGSGNPDHGRTEEDNEDDGVDI
ncbi:hypothetical protein AADZ90_018150 [Aestuariibius sp. 2305UL40-4]|uniref:hypothetical protein n=1 Tax=Aestuariibius violaceus TaxID=3234132 RepID=UPI00345E331E